MTTYETLEDWDRSVLDDIRDDLMRIKNISESEAVDLMDAYYDCVGNPADTDAEDIVSCYIGHFERVADLGEFYADYVGLFAKLNESDGTRQMIEAYFDYTKYGTDLLMDGFSMSEDGHVFAIY